MLLHLGAGPSLPLTVIHAEKGNATHRQEEKEAVKNFDKNSFQNESLSSLFMMRLHEACLRGGWRAYSAHP